MKVIHFESGLGNQMLCYAEYLAVKSVNPDDKVYMENIVYDIPECSQVISMWNGYELEKIFGLKIPNIKDLFTQEERDEFLYDVKQSDFWHNNWNYPEGILPALQKRGLKLENNCQSMVQMAEEKNLKNKIRAVYFFLLKNKFGSALSRGGLHFIEERILQTLLPVEEVFLKSGNDTFSGQTIRFLFRNSGIERIEEQLRADFLFPPFARKENIEMAEFLKKHNSVSIHARRGDALGDNGYCYTNGYFERAVKYIKKNVKDPVFIFFCDPGSIAWCKENSRIFSLNFQKDTVLFADWNKGEESYRDMQLMSLCKHNIITKSSFGWWGSFLNANPEKITCSPDIRINTSHHF